MLTISKPTVDEVDLYDRLRNGRNKKYSTPLEDSRATVLDAYSKYKLANLSTLAPLKIDIATAKALRSNYERLRDKDFRSAYQEIKKRNKICYLCGFRDISEVDHFLPRKIFPEFSTFTFNLIPVCGTCNLKKLEHYKTCNDQLAFIHAYFVDIPLTHSYLQVDLEFNQAVLPSFRIIQTPGMSKQVFETLQYQFSYFGLNDVYSEQAIESLDRKSFAFGEHYRIGGSEKLRDYLDIEARSLILALNPNYWECALFTAISQSKMFCDGGFRLIKGYVEPLD